MKFAVDQPPFYVGYAYEALARAAMVAGDKEAAEMYLTKAKEQAAKVSDAASKARLDNDLAVIS